MTAQTLYQEAYTAHYKKKDYYNAILGYLRVIELYPDSNEARYARQQIPNLEHNISIQELNVSESQRSILAGIFSAIRDQKEQAEQAKEKNEQMKLEREARQQAQQAQRAKLLKRVKSIPLTTTMNIDGYKVKNYIDIESVEVVIGTGIISEFISDFSDFFGERSTPFERKLAEAKKYALDRMRYLAANKGGDAVIGVDIDYTEFTGNRIGVVVNGTIVKLDPPFDFSTVEE